MFEKCTTLAELNAARIEASGKGDIVEINNAYNKRRREIINTKTTYVQLKPIEATTETLPVMSCVPIAGRSEEAGCIKLVKDGFLY